MNFFIPKPDSVMLIMAWAFTIRILIPAVMRHMTMFVWRLKKGTFMIFNIIFADSYTQSVTAIE